MITREDLEAYYEDFFQDVMDEAEAREIYNDDAFFDLSTLDLVEAGVIPNAERMPYIRPRGGIRVDGFCGDPQLYNETGTAQGCVLSLIVIHFNQHNEMQTLTETDMNADFKRLENFLRNSLDAKFRNGLEVTSPGYDLASLIAKRWDQVYKVRLYLLTNMLLSDRVDGKPASEFEGRELLYDVWDLRGFYQINGSAVEREPLIVDFSEYEQGPLRALLASDSSAKEPVYLTAIPGDELARIYDRWGARLLEANVRVFLQARSKVNKGIKNTLENDPEHFFSFNNGITATADGIETIETSRGMQIVKLKNFQIVNGGQTTASVHAALKRKVDLSRVFVQAKITIVTPDNTLEIVPKISEYANSQNRVSSADFFANHPFHVRIEEFSQAIFAPQTGDSMRSTKWFYERARGSYRDKQAYLTRAQKRKFLLEYPRSQTFTKTDLAKYLMVWSDKAYIANLGAQKNFIAFAKEIESAWEQSEDQFGERYFKEVVAKKIIFNATEKIVANRDWYEAGGYRAQHVVLTIGLVWYGTHRMGKSVNFQRIWNEQQVSPLLAEAIERASDAVHEVLMNPDKGYRNISEWAKKEQCWRKVKAAQPNWNQRWVDELLSVDEVKDEQRAAAKDQHELTGIEAQRAVIDMGADFWREVAMWVVARPGVITEKEMGILETAIGIERGKIPSDKQSVVLTRMMKRLNNEGCPLTIGGQRPQVRGRRRRRR